MDEYIARAAALAAIESAMEWDHVHVGDVAYAAVQEIPAADVAPVVHGQWKVLETHATTAMYQCTACGEKMVDYSEREGYHRYCHACGAKMDGGDDHAAD